MKCRLIIIMLFSCCLTNVKGQVHITGIVVDATNKEPVPAVTITIKGTLQVAYTDMQGKFKIDSRDDSVVLLFTSIGYNLKEVSIKTTEKFYDAGIIKFQDEHQQYLDNEKDTIRLNHFLKDSIVIAKIHKVTVHVAYSDFLHFFDSIAAPTANYRIKDFDYGILDVRNKMKKSSQVRFGKSFIKRVGLIAIENFLASMIDRGNVSVYDKNNERQTTIIRIKTGWSGNDECRNCCWYGRKYYLTAHKANFLEITDIIC